MYFVHCLFGGNARHAGKVSPQSFRNGRLRRANKALTGEDRVCSRAVRSIESIPGWVQGSVEEANEDFVDVAVLVKNFRARYRTNSTAYCAIRRAAFP